MLNINKVDMAGVVGNDLEIRTSNMGVLYCRFHLGTTDEKIVDGVSRPITSWHRCIAEEELAEELVATCEKGTVLYITGKIKSHFFDEGTSMKEVTEVVMNSLQIVSDGKSPAMDLDLVLTDALEKEAREANEQDIPY